MSYFDNEVMKAASKVILKKVDLDKVVTKALPAIEKAIEKDIQDFVKENFYDSLAETDFLEKMTDALSAELLKKMGVGTKKNAVQKRKAT